MSYAISRQLGRFNVITATSARACPLVARPRLMLVSLYSDRSATPSQATGTGPSGGDLPDSLADGSAKGRTGGGDPLSSSKNAPPQPKIFNASVQASGEGLTEEQRAEVARHNAEFDKRHDRAAEAASDKVHKKFWGGGGTLEQEERGGKTGKSKKSEESQRG